MQADGIFQRIGTYDIKNAGKGDWDEAGNGICPVLCGAWHGCGVGSAQSVCGGDLYHIVYIGRVQFVLLLTPFQFLTGWSTADLWIPGKKS